MFSLKILESPRHLQQWNVDNHNSCDQKLATVHLSINYSKGISFISINLPFRTSHMRHLNASAVFLNVQTEQSQ